MSSPSPENPESGKSDRPLPSVLELRRDAFRFLKLVLILLAVIVSSRLLLFETWPVQGPSMLPALQENDRVLVFKFPMLLSRLPLLGALNPLQPGDMVVFKTEGPERQKLIKRLIAKGPAGIPREVVRADAVSKNSPSPYDVSVFFDHGSVYVNNQRLNETYLPEGERNSPDVDRVHLKAGEYYVLGDHRSVSKDSRLLGPIPERQMIGEAVFRVWPPSRFGRL